MRERRVTFESLSESLTIGSMRADPVASLACFDKSWMRVSPFKPTNGLEPARQVALRPQTVQIIRANHRCGNPVYFK
jgi:hypothetical protein